MFENLHPVADADLRPVDLGLAGDARSPGPWQQCWTHGSEERIARVVERAMAAVPVVPRADLQASKARCRLLIQCLGVSLIVAVIAVSLVAVLARPA